VCLDGTITPAGTSHGSSESRVVALVCPFASCDAAKLIDSFAKNWVFPCESHCNDVDLFLVYYSRKLGSELDYHAQHAVQQILINEAGWT
jgi:hypothetical protein